MFATLCKYVWTSTSGEGDVSDTGREGQTKLRLVSRPSESNVTDESSEFREKTIYVSDLGDPHLTLNWSLPIAVHFCDDDKVCALSYDLEEFELGEDEFDAIDQLKASIIDLYRLLQGEETNLGPLPKKQWAFLRRLVTEV